MTTFMILLILTVTAAMNHYDMIPMETIKINLSLLQFGLGCVGLLFTLITGFTLYKGSSGGEDMDTEDEHEQ